MIETEAIEENVADVGEVAVILVGKVVVVEVVLVEEVETKVDRVLKVKAKIATNVEVKKYFCMTISRSRGSSSRNRNNSGRNCKGGSNIRIKTKVVAVVDVEEVAEIETKVTEYQ